MKIQYPQFLLIMAAVTVLTGVRHATAQALLDDAFVSNDATSSDTSPAPWTTSVVGTGDVTRGGGVLTLRATGDEWANTNLLGRVRPDLLFFARPVTLKLTGIGIVSRGAAADQQRLRCAIASESKSPYEAKSAVGFVVFADGYVQLGYKSDAPADKPADPESVNVLQSIRFPGPVRNVWLTLGPTDYTLRVDHEPAGGGALVTETRSGRFSDKGPGLNRADWTDGCAVVIQGQKAQGAIENEVTVTIGRVTVEPVPAGG